MLQINNLCKSYGGQVVFDNVSFTLNAGERVGLVGRNGSGKTTLFRMITSEERPDSGTIGMPDGYTIGRLSQHIRFSADTVLAEGCLSLRPSDDFRDESYRVKNILHGLGFSDEDFGLSPSELSGGFQVRLSLAKVLIDSPNLILLDEPTNYLDIVSIRWLGRFLRDWRRELILITHDREFMDSVTAHTMGIHRCKVRKTAGPTHAYYEQIILEEEVHERTRLNDERQRKEIERFINRFRAQANKARAVQSRIKALQKRERLQRLTGTKDLDFSFNAAPFTGKQLAEVSDLTFGFEPDRPLIKGLSFTVGKKDRIAVIGKNGKGKTTLLNLLAGEFGPTGGSISRHQQLRTAYFGQTNINRLDETKTVEEEIMSCGPDIGRGRARGICGLMMFEGDMALKKIRVLSGGERSRVLLGRLLASPANLLLLDEPTNHLDMESIDSLIEAIEEFEGSVIIVTHSEMVLDAVAERLIVFDGGEPRVFEGTYRDFLDRSGWEDEPEEAAQTAVRPKSSGRKENRRARAELINDRSRTLGPLQARISECERTVIGLEEKIERDTEALLKASASGDAGAIMELSQAIQKAKEEAERFFDEVVRLTEEQETKAREFEDRLRSLQG